MPLGVKLHVDAIGHHPKVFFLQISLFSINRVAIFQNHRRVSNSLPLYAGVGSDHNCKGYVQHALIKIVEHSKIVYKLKNNCKAIISAAPVFLSGDRAVLPMFTGGATPSQAAAAIFEVELKKQHLNIFCVVFNPYMTILHKLDIADTKIAVSFPLAY